MDKRMIQLASIAAMKGILSNDTICRNISDDEELIYDDIAEYAIGIAKALARKWEDME